MQIISQMRLIGFQLGPSRKGGGGLFKVYTCFVILFLLFRFQQFSIRIIGSIGGAKKTFACKSQECLWQDWYILI